MESEARQNGHPPVFAAKGVSQSFGPVQALEDVDFEQNTLRATLGRHELDDVLANQAAINEQLKGIVDRATEPWGIQVVAVETEDVDLPDTMKRTMARQAEVATEHNSTLVLPIPMAMPESACRVELTQQADGA